MVNIAFFLLKEARDVYLNTILLHIEQNIRKHYLISLSLNMNGYIYKSSSFELGKVSVNIATFWRVCPNREWPVSL